MGRVVKGVMGEGVGGCLVGSGVLAGGWSGRVGGSAVVVIGLGGLAGGWSGRVGGSAVAVIGLAVVVIGLGGGGSLVVLHSQPIVGDFGRLCVVSCKWF